MKNKNKFSNILEDQEYYNTNVKNILVWLISTKKPYFPYPHDNEKDNNIQLEMAFSFLKYRDLFIRKLNCLQEKTEINNNVQFHRFQTSKQMGELEVISPCEQIIVNVTKGENLPCFLNHLTIMINNSIFGVSPFARILKNTSNLIPVQCHEAPVFLRLISGQFIGNSGKGFQIIQVEDENFTMDHIHQIYFNHEYDNNYDLASTEEIELSNLALDATEYKLKIQTSWFLNLYTNTIQWLSHKWQTIVLLVGAIMASIGAVVCISYSYYMLKCTKLFFHPRHEPNIDEGANNILLRERDENHE
ncbi:MAG: hypothetical protein GY739_16730 [Mesoflavibacter sp.]|nr:hypothetical protein [Mesoflavibacter sp.]